MIMVVKESWLDPNQSELENTKPILIMWKKGKKKVKEWKSMEPARQGPGPHHHNNESHHSRQIVCFKRHVRARRQTKRKTRPGHCQQIILSFFCCTLWVLNDDGVK